MRIAACVVLPECCPTIPGRTPKSATKLPLCRHFQRTGATGLEPATSGVKGHFEGRDVNDEAHGIALFLWFFGCMSKRFA